MGRSDTIKSYSSFVLLPSLLPLLQVDTFLLTLVSGCIRPCDTNNSTKRFTRIYRHIATDMICQTLWTVTGSDLLISMP